MLVLLVKVLGVFLAADGHFREGVTRVYARTTSGASAVAASRIGRLAWRVIDS